MNADEEYEAAYGSLHGAGLTPSPDYDGSTLETGHQYYLQEPAYEDHWKMIIKHPGDPTGSYISSYLGSDPHRVGGHALRELGQPDVMHEMAGQARRAEAAGDPRGEHDLNRHNGPVTKFFHYGNPERDRPRWE